MGRTFDIAVAGLGIAGSAVAARLARDGHRVTVLERATRLGPVGAGILLQPSGQAILDRWGLLGELAPRCEPIEALHAVHSGGRTLVRIPYAMTGSDCRGLGVHRAHLFELLHRECVETGVTIRLGVEVTDRIDAADHVRVRDTDGREHGPFDWLLIADGSHSRLRRRLAQVRFDHEYRYGALWRVGHLPDVRGELRQTVRGTRQLIGLLPTGGGRCSFFASLRADDRVATIERGFEPWRDEIVATCPLAAPLLAELRNFDDLVFTTYRAVWMKSPRGPRTLFLGDAAHATSPHLGQGVNLALIDAEELATAVRETGDLEPAARLFQRRRRAQIRFYALLTAALTPFFQSSGFVKARLRDLALPWLPRVPWISRQMALTMSGVKTDWLQSGPPFVLGRD